ncbi:MAG: type II secretion system F family protein [Pseudodesulfovibrio sp.]
MPVFSYKAALKNGKVKKGLLEAANRTQAGRRLRADGLYPIDLIEEKSRSGKSQHTAPLSRQLHLFRRVSRDSIAATIRQLATLLKADLPLDKALDAIAKGDARQSELNRVVSDIRESIREGRDLASAFSNYPRLFNTTFVTMVRAGENSGTLDIVMERLADHIDQQLALRRKLQATLAYPILMMIVGCCVVVFLLSFVVPKVTEIFFDMGRELPLPTQILIATSDMVRHNGLILLGLLLAALVGANRFRKTERGRAFFDAALLRTPILGGIIRLLAVGRFSKTLGMLLKNGVSLLNSLDIIRSVSGNTAMKAVVGQVYEDVQEGKLLSGPLEASRIFEHAAVQMISAGEQSGRLDEMLLIVADDCESKVSVKLQMLTSLMEPLMILLLGGMVGFVVMAIMLPIFEMSNLVGG